MPRRLAGDVVVVGVVVSGGGIVVGVT